MTRTPLLLLLLCSTAFADEVASRELYHAIRMVESGGDDKAVGDGGMSKGPLQCSRAAWKDACEWGGVDWDYDELVWSWPHAKYIFHCYVNRYGAKTPEEMARAWTSGPKWREKYHLTNEYWNKVQEMMR